MEDVTVSLPDETKRWLQGEAAKAGFSVSRWVAELLQGLMNDQRQYAAAMERLLAIKPRKFEWVDGRRPTREELHDRAGLR